MDLHKLNLTQLKELAKDRGGITNLSKLNKEELIVELEKRLKEIEEDEETQGFTENGDYKLTNENDSIVEGLLEIMPDGYGFLRGHN